MYFGGKRLALVPPSGDKLFYIEDLLGSSRLIAKASAVCYDADFTPFGGEKAYTNTCSQNYKFEGKERDAETQNDNFEAREYSWRFGRWLTSDWSSTPVAVPYANLSNPQTLNLYAMVSDDPESFADLDGHDPDPVAVASPNDNTTQGGCVPAGSAQCNPQPPPPPKPPTPCGFFCKLFHTKAYEQMTEEHRQWLINNAKSEAAKDRLRHASAEDINSAYFCMQSASCYSQVMASVAAASAGSTGRSQPNNLHERLAMEQAQSDPMAGQQIKNIQMKDPRWPESKGWVKMRQNINGTEIHYVRNSLTGAVDDWKFIDP